MDWGDKNKGNLRGMGERMFLKNNWRSCLGLRASWAEDNYGIVIWSQMVIDGEAVVACEYARFGRESLKFCQQKLQRSSWAVGIDVYCTFTTKLVSQFQFQRFLHGHTRLTQDAQVNESHQTIVRSLTTSFSKRGAISLSLVSDSHSHMLIFNIVWRD